MIKAIGHKDGHPCMVFGLSEGNLEMLRQGKPIVINLAALGLSGGEVVICYGQTEQDILHDFQRAGLIPGMGQN